MPEPCSILIEELIELRKAKGWTQNTLASACGLTQSVIARIESKRSVPTVSTLYKIVSALGASLVLEKKTG